MELCNSEIVELIAQNSYSQLVFLKNSKESTYCWSKQAEKQFGYPNLQKEEEELWSYLICSDEYASFIEQLRMLEEGKIKLIDQEYRIRNASNTFYRCSLLIKRLNEKSDCLIGIIKDMYNTRTIDFVTELPYSDSFRAILSNKMSIGKSGAVLLIGIDDFKRINDLYSYSFGDKVLHHFSTLVQAIFPEKAQLFRLDGDSFGVIMTGMTKNDILQYYEQVNYMVQKPHEIADISLTLTISGGLCFFPDDGTDCESLYRNARIALRCAKQKGKNQLIIYSKEISQIERYNMKLFEKLRDSIRLDFKGFSLHYQPLIHSENGSLYGCEALLRWSSPDFPEGVSPYQFIPVLETSGLILEVGKWVIDHAMKQCKEWSKKMPNFQMNINVSSRQFENPQFQFYVIETLAKYHLNPELITLELTESGEIIDSDTVRKAFDFLRGQRIKIAFDDFGTGYASLGIFRILSADELKIDRSFLERISYDITDQKIIGQIIHLCHSMNMKVCVEGIESMEMEQIIQQLGADLMQGYYYGKPLSADLFSSQFFSKIDAEQGHTGHKDDKQNSLFLSPAIPVQSLSLEEIVDNAHAGIFQVGMDIDFTFLTCNEGYRRMLGYTTKEINDKFKNKALGFVHPDDMEYVNTEIRRQLGEGDTVLIEFRIVRSDGKTIWILGTGNVVKSKNGKPSLIVNIIENNPLKLRSLAIEKQCSMYQELMKKIPTGIKCVKLDPDFTIEYISPSFISLLGYSEQEIFEDLEGKLIHLIYNEDLYEMEKDIERQLSFGDIVTMRYRCVCKDGRMIWIETISRICFNEEDGVPRSYSSVVDISDTIDGISRHKEINLASRYQTAVRQWDDIYAEYKDEKREVNQHSQQPLLDDMMNVLNKAATEQKIRDTLSACAETDFYAFYMVDIDNFKDFNHQFGHLTGDYILKTTALRLKNIFTPMDIVGRVGGDEFIIFSSYDGEKKAVYDQAKCIKEKLNEDINYKNNVFSISVSVGVACYPIHAKEFYELFSRADSALYRAKALGKNRFCMVHE